MYIPTFAISLMDILYTSRHVVVATKPAGIDVHGRSAEDPSCFVAQVAAWLKVPARKLHPASRLDKQVSGLVPIAMSKIGRKSLTEQYQRRQVQRTYVALVRPALEPGSGLWDAAIGPDPKNPRQQVVGSPKGKKAITAFRTLERLDESHSTFVELKPKTGRTHQLRVHLAAAGSAVLGDRRYGGARQLTSETGTVLPILRVMLHAQRISFVEPEDGHRVSVEGPLAPDMRDLRERLQAQPFS